MIPALVARAVVKVLDATQGTLGTGFLVAPALVLTAKHVIGSRTELRVQFSTDDAADAALAEPLPADDWALLRVNHVPLDIAPLPLGTIGNLAREVVWYSIGYTRLRDGLRGSFHGVVRTVTDELELFCTELVGCTYDDARGLSGGPCIVDGEAVGVITDVLRRGATGAIVAGQVHALPLAAIRPANGALPQLAPHPLPWELVFRGALERLGESLLEVAAAEARLANFVMSANAPRQIARRMINQGVVVTAAVLRQLRDDLAPNKIDAVMCVAETLWVDGLAAESMAAVIENRRVGVLATDLDWSAQHHLWRAYACRCKGAVPWTHVVVDAHTEESFAEAVRERALDELDKAFDCRGDRAELKRRVAEEPQTTVFVVSVPRNDVITMLRDELADVVIVFLSRAVPAAANAVAADVLAPELTRTMEDRALLDNTAAHARLKRR
jgi:hypothetical protein